MLEVERAALPAGSARAPALERDAELGQLTGPCWLCRSAETCNQDVDPSVREEDLSTGKRGPRRQGSVTLLLHLHASIRLPAFHLASCCALAGLQELQDRARRWRWLQATPGSLAHE